MRFRRDEAGFTLIELLIVVVIIGILAAVGVPIYTRYIYSARASEAPTVLMALAEYGKSYIRAHPQTWQTSGLLTADAGTDSANGGISDGDWVDEVVGQEEYSNMYFDYVYDSTNFTITAVPKSGAPNNGFFDPSTDTMSYNFQTDAWSAGGRLTEVMPD